MSMCMKRIAARVARLRGICGVTVVADMVGIL